MSHVENLNLVAKGNAIAVNSDVEYQSACEFLKGATALERQIVAHYQPMKAAAHALHAQIVEAEREQRKPLNAVIDRVKAELISFDNRRQIEALRLQAEQQAAIDKATPKGMLAPQVQIAAEVPKSEGISRRANWKAVVTDESLLPREYLMPDMVKLNAAAKRMQASFNVPGAKAENDSNIVVKGV